MKRLVLRIASRPRPLTRGLASDPQVIKTKAKRLLDERSFDSPEVFVPLARYLGLEKLELGRTLDLDKKQLVGILKSKDKALIHSLYRFSDAFTRHVFGPKVYARAIIEFSNVCEKDCFYCGLGKHMKVKRYTMSKEEILECAEFAYEQGMGTVTLQSGELPTQKRIDFLKDVVKSIRSRTVQLHVMKKEGRTNVTEEDLKKSAKKGLCVALSLGELPEDVYKQFYEVGAHRYLLRIETSDPDLYSRLHPKSHSFDTRLECLQSLRKLGYQVGTGVMVGLPYQTYEHMAGDLLWFKKFQPDMIGMGPYVLQADTPLGKVWMEERKHFKKEDFEREKEELLDLTTRMYALARLTLGNVNITATTALQVLDPSGREIALQRGCNVVMPIITPLRLRENYQIYQDKPCIDEDSVKCTGCLNMRVKLAGKVFSTDGQWYDPPHYYDRLPTAATV